MSKCKSCGSKNVTENISFGSFPNSRGFTKEPVFSPHSHQIDLIICKDCELIYMADEPNPLQLYSSDFYSTAFQKPKHIDDLIATCLSLGKEGSALDIGCNDGALLQKLIEVGYETVGVEPNVGPAETAKNNGHHVEIGFFDQEMAHKLKKTHGLFDAIFARHVLEHVSSPKNFLMNALSILKPCGTICIEVPDVDVGLAAGNPVMLWEEHLNYFTKRHLSGFFSSFDLELVAYREYVFGGGAVAYFLKRQGLNVRNVSSCRIPVNDSVDLFEYKNHTVRVIKAYDCLKKIVEKLDIQIVAYGAGPRTSTFLNYVDGCADLDALFDDREEIQNLYLPNMGVKVSAVSSYAFSKKATVILLGVGAEIEPKIKNKLESVSQNLIYVSLFYPKNVLWSLNAAITSIDEKFGPGITDPILA